MLPHVKAQAAASTWASTLVETGAAETAKALTRVMRAGMS
jgi:hypothetical protein